MGCSAHQWGPSNATHHPSIVYAKRLCGGGGFTLPETIFFKRRLLYCRHENEQWPSVLRRCWLGGRKGTRPVKTEWWGAGVVICMERGADLHMAQLMPLLLTISCSSKIQIGFTCLVPAHMGSPGKGLKSQVLAPDVICQRQGQKAQM